MTLIRDLWSPATIHVDTNRSAHRSSVTVVDYSSHLYQKHREAVRMSVFVKEDVGGCLGSIDQQ